MSWTAWSPEIPSTSKHSVILLGYRDLPESPSSLLGLITTHLNTRPPITPFQFRPSPQKKAPTSLNAKLSEELSYINQSSYVTCGWISSPSPCHKIFIIFPQDTQYLCWRFYIQTAFTETSNTTRPSNLRMQQDRKGILSSCSAHHPCVPKYPPAQVSAFSKRMDSVEGPRPH